MYLNLMRTRQNWDNNSYLLQTPFEANGCGPASFVAYRLAAPVRIDPI
jgi:hypothetical protein